MNSNFEGKQTLFSKIFANEKKSIGGRELMSLENFNLFTPFLLLNHLHSEKNNQNPQPFTENTKVLQKKWRMGNIPDGKNCGWEPFCLSQRGGRPQKSPGFSNTGCWMWASILYQGAPAQGRRPPCQYLTKLTKALGEVCMEAFAPLNFSFRKEIGHKHTLHRRPTGLLLPT